MERPSAVHEARPCGEVMIQRRENGGEVRGNRAAFIAAHDAAGVVDQREIVIKVSRKEESLCAVPMAISAIRLVAIRTCLSGSSWLF